MIGRKSWSDYINDIFGEWNDSHDHDIIYGEIPKGCSADEKHYNAYNHFMVAS